MTHDRLVNNLALDRRKYSPIPDSAHSANPPGLVTANVPELWYLATPITHHSRRVMWKRMWAAARVAGELLKEGYMLICPATHSIPIEAECTGMDKYDWLKLDEEAFLTHCDGIIVGELPGWRESKGIKRELEYANLHHMKVHNFKCRQLFTEQEWADLSS